MKSSHVCSKAFILLLSVSAFGQSFETNFEIFWPENLLVIDVQAPLVSGQILPVRRLQTENLVKQNLSEITLAAVSNIVVDYRGTIRDYAIESPALYSYLLSLSEKLVLDFSRSNTEFTRLLSRYSLPLTHLITPFVRHDRPLSVRGSFDLRGADDITGLVIYAAGQYPVHGENTLARLRPSLFPRILSQRTEVIFSRETLEPNLLQRQPPVLFSNNLAEAPFRQRIGNRPFRITLHSIYGVLRNDLILLDEDVERLLSSENGLNILTEGRIVIIID